MDIFKKVTALLVNAKRTRKPIPFVTQHTINEAESISQHKAVSNLRFNNVQVLLVEDNPVNQKVATLMLEKYGCHVTPAGNGMEAVKLFKNQNFDLIFMDCQMPIMDGF